MEEESYGVWLPWRRPFTRVPPRETPQDVEPPTTFTPAAVGFSGYNGIAVLLHGRRASFASEYGEGRTLEHPGL